MEDKNRDLLKIFAIPITAVVILSVWFFEVQTRGEYLVTPVIFGFEGLLGVIEMSISSMLTHLSFNHFLGNLFAVSGYLLLVTALQKNRWVLLQLGILFVPNIYVLSVHTRAVGISGFASSILGCVFVLYIYVTYATVTSPKVSRRSKIAVGLIITIILYSSTQHVFDMFVYFDIVSIQNPSFAEVLVHDISENYTSVSSKLHVLGLIFGLVVGTVFFYISYITRFSVMRR